MAPTVDMIEVLQKLIFDTKKGTIVWERVLERSPLWNDITDAHILRGEGFSTHIKGGLIVAALRVREGIYDSEENELRWFNSHCTVIYNAQEKVIRKVDGPDVVNQRLFDEARASTFPAELDALEQFLKDEAPSPPVPVGPKGKS